MLSYQHAFHAGNHADVLKHLVLIAVLEKLNKKTKPYFAFDTHAGAGIYNTSNLPNNADELAFEKLLEAEEGLNMAKHSGPDSTAADSTVKSTVNNAVKKYVEILQKYAVQDLYPGSPIIMSECARVQDSLHANELAEKMFERLVQSDAIHVPRNKSINLHQRDAYASMKALLPPSPKRGMVLIDPPYEQASEYDQVIEAINAALKKWPKGIFLIWYPLLSPKRVNRKTKQVEINPKAHKSADMLAALKQNIQSTDLIKQCTGGMLSIEFAQIAASQHIGMYGSGVCIINPPYELSASLEMLLSVLKKHIQLDDNKLSSINWHIHSL